MLKAHQFGVHIHIHFQFHHFQGTTMVSAKNLVAGLVLLTGSNANNAFRSVDCPLGNLANTPDIQSKSVPVNAPLNTDGRDGSFYRFMG